jgi:hypothetical protein
MVQKAKDNIKVKNLLKRARVAERKVYQFEHQVKLKSISRSPLQADLFVVSTEISPNNKYDQQCKIYSLSKSRQGSVSKVALKKLKLRQL